MEIRKKRLVSYFEKRKVRRVGLDTMCFIYHFEKNYKYLPITETLFRQIERGRWAGVTSVLTLLEVLTGTRKAGNQEMAEKYRFIFRAFPNLTMVMVDEAVADHASVIRAEYGIRTPDAIQLATAFLHHADIFLTNDETLKRVSDIEVITLDDLSI